MSQPQTEPTSDAPAVTESAQSRYERLVNLQRTLKIKQETAAWIVSTVRPVVFNVEKTHSPTYIKVRYLPEPADVPNDYATDEAIHTAFDVYVTRNGLYTWFKEASTIVERQRAGKLDPGETMASQLDELVKHWTGFRADLVTFLAAKSAVAYQLSFPANLRDDSVRSKVVVREIKAAAERVAGRTTAGDFKLGTRAMLSALSRRIGKSPGWFGRGAELEARDYALQAFARELNKEMQQAERGGITPTGSLEECEAELKARVDLAEKRELLAIRPQIEHIYDQLIQNWTDAAGLVGMTPEEVAAYAEETLAEVRGDNLIPKEELAAARTAAVRERLSRGEPALAIEGPTLA